MEIPLEITFRGMGHSDAVEQRIREKTAKLSRFQTPITSCRVLVDAPHHHHRKGNLFSVRIELAVPGGEVVASRDNNDHSHEDVYVTIRDAFAAAARQLEQHIDRHRGG